jgi:hypothetical protein
MLNTPPLDGNPGPIPQWVLNAAIIHENQYGVSFSFSLGSAIR